MLLPRGRFATGGIAAPFIPDLAEAFIHRLIRNRVAGSKDPYSIFLPHCGRWAQRSEHDAIFRTL
jgi:hypothetical protein